MKNVSSLAIIAGAVSFALLGLFAYIFIFVSPKILLVFVPSGVFMLIILVRTFLPRRR